MSLTILYSPGKRVVFDRLGGYTLILRATTTRGQRSPSGMTMYTLLASRIRVDDGTSLVTRGIMSILIQQLEPPGARACACSDLHSRTESRRRFWNARGSSYGCLVYGGARWLVCVALGNTQMRKAVRCLSGYNQAHGVGANFKVKRALAQLIVMICEAARMSPPLDMWGKNVYIPCTQVARLLLELG